ncbi:MAG TPA: glycosyltransferase [Pirellulales bacterium]|jgi:glycosyltransferase involved in cell wall biosynthesis|nr:glycosyltransferase [Pirellulales bacterium]
MHLTILVPTYNRSSYLDGLLDRFSRSTSFRSLEGIEVVVANNCSTDDSLATVERYRAALPQLRLVNHSVHVPSAEQNVFRSLEHCCGDYTWVLGDDDVPMLENLSRVLQALRTHQPDLLITNCPVVSPRCEVLAHSVVQMHGASHTVDIVEIAERYGFWYFLAGFSLQMVRTSVLRTCGFQPWLEISVIYSHVAAYLERFKGRKTLVLNCPLTWCVARNDRFHWKRAAERLGVCDDFFWTLGFLRQLRRLIERGVLPATYLSYALHADPDGLRRLVFTVTERLFRQVVRMRLKPSRRQMLSAHEFDEICAAVVSAEPLYREIAQDLRSLYTRPSSKWRWLNPHGAIEEILAIYKLKQHVDQLRVAADNYLDAFYLLTHAGFQVYRIGDICWAVRETHRQRLYEELAHVDAHSVPETILRDVSVDGIIAQVDALVVSTRQHPSISQTNGMHRLDAAAADVGRPHVSLLGHGGPAGRDKRRTDAPSGLVKKVARLVRDFQKL